MAGNPCACLTVQLTLDTKYSQTKPSFSSINESDFFKPHDHESQKFWFREDKSQEETSEVISEKFQGFLTIGTLGAEPATPTFASPLGNIPMKDAAVTETQLKLISYELEKFVEADEECFYESSGRISFRSNVTLSRKKTDGLETEDLGNKVICPLQEYLLGSSFEIREKTEVRIERASVRETQVKQGRRSALHIIKKMSNMVLSSSKSCNTYGNTADHATSTNEKLCKVLYKFHRKVFPKDTKNANNFTKSHKGKIKSTPRDCFDEYENGDITYPNTGRRFHLDSKSKNWSKHCEINWKLPQDGLSSGSLGNNEHWINTDPEYLVLEL
ncbi:WRKY transcription factor-like protein, putative [Medicago truncatula]|uniref:WRKY transcription factor-like protein, putative n=1 Tax=Medicago truncatula TaxID=3880 RepID=G7L372_MEDTR|nr:WRKY transcription factor-like protein, putative [Medicago truncatula]